MKINITTDMHAVDLRHVRIPRYQWRYFEGFAAIILCMGSVNERRCYIVTSSFIGWAHTQNTTKHESYTSYQWWTVLHAPVLQSNLIYARKTVFFITNFLSYVALDFKANRGNWSIKSLCAGFCTEWDTLCSWKCVSVDVFPTPWWQSLATSPNQLLSTYCQGTLLRNGHINDEFQIDIFRFYFILVRIQRAPYCERRPAVVKNVNFYESNYGSGLFMSFIWMSEKPTLRFW